VVGAEAHFGERKVGQRVFGVGLDLGEAVVARGFPF
jgi:hypothetical protein